MLGRESGNTISGTIYGDRMNHDPAFRLSAMKAAGRVSQRYLFLRTLSRPSHLIGQKVLGIASRSRVLSSLIERKYRPEPDPGSAGTATIYNVPFASWGHWIRPDSHTDRSVDTIRETATPNLMKGSVRLARPILEQTNTTSVLRRSMYTTSIPRYAEAKRLRNTASTRELLRPSLFITGGDAMSSVPPSARDLAYSEVQPGRLNRSVRSTNPSKPLPTDYARSSEDKGLASSRSFEKQPLLPRAFRAVIDLMKFVNRKQATSGRISKRDELSGQTTSDAVPIGDSRIIHAGEIAVHPAESTTPPVADLLRVRSELKETRSHTATPLVSVKRIFSPINVARPPISLDKNDTRDSVRRSILARGLTTDASTAISISKYSHPVPESQSLHRTLTQRHGVSAGEHPIDSPGFTTPYKSDTARYSAGLTVASKHVTPLPASLQAISISKYSHPAPESQPLYRTLTQRHGVSAEEHPIDSLSFTTPYSSDIARSTADRMVTSKHVTPLPVSLQRSVQETTLALDRLPLAVPASAGGSSRLKTLTRTVSPQPRQDIPSPVESALPEVADKTNVESVEEREQRNVEIAEFVIRKLSTMLEVERDRRGYSRWH